MHDFIKMGNEMQELLMSELKKPRQRKEMKKMDIRGLTLILAISSLVLGILQAILSQ